MKVTAHIMVSKGHGLGISASQWPYELENSCEEHNREHYGEEYLSKPRDQAVVTVEFEVPDSVFERQERPVVEGMTVGK
jgi:hypothetical protein